MTIVNELNDANKQIEKLKEDLAKANVKSDQFRSVAEVSVRREVIAVKRSIELEQDAITQCGGQYTVRTCSARKVAGKTVKAGEVLGFITPAAGVNPKMIIDAVMYRTALVEESIDQDTDGQLDTHNDAIERVKELEGNLQDAAKELGEKSQEIGHAKGLIEVANQNSETLEDRVKELEGQLEEANNQIEEMAKPETNKAGAGKKNDQK
ncbi:hypothetical protein COB72_09275 [bacterium]|nr:MAG: hypothetical protein COB72_09275 [bacterium]